MSECPHANPRHTGRMIRGVFGKDNLPGQAKPVTSFGAEAWCSDCGAHLIVHDRELHFTERATIVEELHGRDHG